ncbi:MAG: hypothetical protein IJ729_06360 [Alloprevotella sp.]|nr:hypothetical protein [Alloprevotella sp.]
MGETANKQTSKQVDELLERYLAAQTTEAEEQQLREALDEGSDARFLQALASAADAPCPTLDTSRLERTISRWEAIEETTRQRTWSISWRWFAALAACIVMAFILPVALQPEEPQQPTALRDTYDDPQRAAQEAEQAMAKFSECLDKGLALLQKEDH